MIDEKKLIEWLDGRLKLLDWNDGYNSGQSDLIMEIIEKINKGGFEKELKNEQG